jgi:glycyl-tRNA synthetase beta chain
MSRATLLVELLTEELPPKALPELAFAFANKVTDGLLGERFTQRDGPNSVPLFDPSKLLATPRRLAILVPGVLASATDDPQEVDGPPITAKPEAVAGFAKKQGVDPSALQQRDGPKGKIYFAKVIRKGATLDAKLADIVADAVKKLPIPKVMRWGAGEAQFVRPVHGLVMLHGSRVVPGTVLGLQSGNKTRGHRFMSSGDIALANADEYEQKLLAGHVVADFVKRKSQIDAQLQAEAKKQNASLGEYAALLDEVTALVEHPSVYVGEFDRAFLEVPQECLILTMQQHQRYLPLFDAGGKLTGKFLIVSNMQIADPSHIIGGNQRVVRPRLEDARFFYNQDRKQQLEERVPLLAKVVYHNKIGTQLDRVKRVQSLSERIAHALQLSTQIAESAKTAAWLAKADLLTAMVGEFPELQGTMGRYYALNEGHSVEIAAAIEQHYWPRFSGDLLPEGPVACVVAIADKMLTIADLFGIGQPPTGDKDPFALRRQALGVVRILIERKLDIRMQALVDLALGELPPNSKTDWLPVLEFLLDRARSYFADQGFATQAIESVLQPFGSSSFLHLLPDTIAEASRFISTSEGKILAEANKRITNILKKSGFEVPFGRRPDQLARKPNPSLFKETAEKELWSALQLIGEKSVALKRDQKFADSLRVLSELGGPTKTFFDEVLVNADEPDVRDNRITLLQHARAYMNQVAELSLMAQ